jgi:hypothetical protein
MKKKRRKEVLMMVKSKNICGVILWFLLMRECVRELRGIAGEV